jgi:hypothetical protein
MWLWVQQLLVWLQLHPLFDLLLQLMLLLLVSFLRLLLSLLPKSAFSSPSRLLSRVGIALTFSRSVSVSSFVTLMPPLLL